MKMLDVNPDSLVDMVVQPVRVNNGANANAGYNLLVRVYRADAFSQGTFEIQRSKLSNHKRNWRSHSPNVSVHNLNFFHWR